MLRPRGRAAIALLSVALAAGLSACGNGGNGGAGDSDSTAVDFDALMQMSQAQLYEEAKKEGTLLFYSAQASEKTDAVVQAFQDTYPDITVSVYRAGSDTILPRIVQEQRAGRRGNDVVDFGAFEQGELGKAGLTQPYTGSAKEGLAEGAVHDTWTAARFLVFAPSWNTQKVRPADAPKTWESLADPKWNGQMAIEATDIPFFWNLYQYFLKSGKSQQEADKILEDIFDGAASTDGHTTTAQLMASGEYALTAANFTSTVQTLADDGAPIDYRPPVSPVFAEPSGVGIMKTAPHPASAVLFVNWMLTDGQKAVAEEANDIPTGKAAQPDWIKGTEVIPFDTDGYAAQAEQWTARIEGMIRK
jgi:iron(III) transport system substrate-binding protein